MRASLHVADDPDWLLDFSAVVTYMTFATLITEPPSDTDIEQCECRNDHAKVGSDEILECQDPRRERG